MDSTTLTAPAAAAAATAFGVSSFLASLDLAVWQAMLGALVVSGMAFLIAAFLKKWNA